jgi:chitin deacetylase
MLFLCISLLSFSSFRVFAAASVLPAHPHELHSDFPATWFHPESHPILTLFRHTRNGINISTDGNDYPPVGSSGTFLLHLASAYVLADLPPLLAWISAYPKASGSGPVDPETMPKAWKDFLETAIKEGKIPNIPQTTLVNGTPTYPNGTDPNSSQVCSAIPKNCKIDGDYWNAPIGHVALAFDDGPGLVSG